MMKKILGLGAMLLVFISISGIVMSVALPQTAVADDKCHKGFLGFPSWYEGLALNEDDCSIQSPSGEDGMTKFVITIGMNVLSIILMLAGYISLAFVLYGGFLLITSRGKPNDIAGAQMTIRSAIIGLAISFGAVPVVRYAAAGISEQKSAFGLPATDPNAMLGIVLGSVYWVAGVIAVITLIIAGYTYVISGGNPAEVEKSKNTVLYAVIGLIIIAGAFTITQFVIGRF